MLECNAWSYDHLRQLPRRGSSALHAVLWQHSSASCVRAGPRGGDAARNRPPSHSELRQAGRRIHCSAGPDVGHGVGSSWGWCSTRRNRAHPRPGSRSNSSVERGSSQRNACRLWATVRKAAYTPASAAGTARARGDLRVASRVGRDENCQRKTSEQTGGVGAEWHGNATEWTCQRASAHRCSS